MKTIKDVPNEYMLITNSQDIKPILKDLGKQDLFNEIGLLFVKTSDAEYDSIYYSESNVPYNNSLIWKLK